MKGITYVIGIVVLLFLVGLLAKGCGLISFTVNESIEVAKDEFGLKAALKKYEWFKDAAETLNEKRSTIQIYQTNVDMMNEDFEGLHRSKWSTIDKQQYNQWRMEVTGIKASYNKVAKEYNAQSSKFNWEMFNTEDVPKKFDLYITK